jgi:hypothetical protein
LLDAVADEERRALEQERARVQARGRAPEKDW